MCDAPARAQSDLCVSGSPVRNASRVLEEPEVSSPVSLTTVSPRCTLTFTLIRVPVPQGSMRSFVPKGWRPAVTTHPHLHDWRMLVAEAAGHAATGESLEAFKHVDGLLPSAPARRGGPDPAKSALERPVKSRVIEG